MLPFLRHTEQRSVPPVPHDSHYYPPLQASHSNGYDANIYTTSTLAGVLMLMLRTYMFIRLVARSSVYHNASARVLAMGHNSNFEITPLVMLKGLLANNHGVIAFLFGALVVTFAYASFALESVVDQEPPTRGIKGFLDCLWMTLVTMTTVGGDLVPHTYGGRLVMAVTSLVSMGLFGVIVNQAVLRASWLA